MGKGRGWAQVDLGAVKCALVVCDTEWRNCSSAEESGEEHLAAADYLRLDSMVSHRCPCAAVWGMFTVCATAVSVSASDSSVGDVTDARFCQQQCSTAMLKGAVAHQHQDHQPDKC